MLRGHMKCCPSAFNIFLLKGHTIPYLVRNVWYLVRNMWLPSRCTSHSPFAPYIESIGPEGRCFEKLFYKRCCLITSLLCKLQAQILPDATPPLGKIPPFTRIAVTFELMKKFRCPLRHMTGDTQYVIFLYFLCICASVCTHQETQCLPYAGHLCTLIYIFCMFVYSYKLFKLLHILYKFVSLTVLCLFFTARCRRGCSTNSFVINSFIQSLTDGL